MRFIMAITSLYSTPARVMLTGSSWSSCCSSNSERKGLKLVDYQYYSDTR